jgi:hypothetical protein
MGKLNQFSSRRIRKLNRMFDAASNADVIEGLICARIILISQDYTKKEYPVALYLSDVLYLELLRRGLKL